jgi:predicted phage terminase large subunit-like protein
MPGKWRCISIPALIDEDYVATLPAHIQTLLRESCKDSPRDEKGRFSYWEYKEPLAELLEMEKGIGQDQDGNRVSRFVFASQYQQAPKVLGGDIIHDKFPRCDVLPKMKYRIIYGDTAQKTAERNDYSVFECWGLGEDGRIYLIDLIRGKWEAPDLKKKAREFWQKHTSAELYRPLMYGRVREMKIEDKASGTGLIQDLKRGETVDGVSWGPIPVKAIERNKDKLTRVMDVVSYIDAALVCVLGGSPWISDFIAECEAFTADDTHAHDDQIDPMCDAISDMLGPKPKSFFV